MHTRLIGISGLVLVSLVAVTVAEEKSGTQQAARLDVLVPIRLNYLLYLPKNYEDQEQWPLLLFLHGSGERGDDLELVKKHGPPKLIASGMDFPFIVVSPQCPQDRRWEPIELVALLDNLSARYKVDTDRIYVTGLSMGGFGTWELASFAPNKLAAVAPICGGGEKYWVKAYAHLPVWVFHGAKDTAVPLERSQVLVDELKKLGADPKFTIYPDAAHDSWTESYAKSAVKGKRVDLGGRRPLKKKSGRTRGRSPAPRSP
ncbi:MAG: prolyl oligopeptidase family serine peptidase, partial [Planctomycetaceae bacterium]|nr:prolyl oligopeptidase family serine peptidase [Planctomycetaceae bacterium]